MIKMDLSEILSGMYDYLMNHEFKNSRLSERSFYGESFALAFLNIFKENTNLHSRLKKSFSFIDPNDPSFHAEFNVYALLQIAEKGRADVFSNFISDTKLGNNNCTNWYLLRAYINLKREPGNQAKILDALLKFLTKRVEPSGFIRDDSNVHSFQYHCFSCAICHEIFSLTQNQSILQIFLRGVDFIKNFILPDGDTLYIGRGQQQLFGYASLSYILAAAYTETNNPQYLFFLNKVIAFIKQYQLKNGCIPLVLNDLHTSGTWEKADITKERYAGWYAYNNFFDYFCFSAFFLARSLQLLGNELPEIPEFHPNYSYSDNIFTVQKHNELICVWSKPGGVWTNDLPYPYIYYNGHKPLPSFGGEQYEKSLYSLKGIPWPWNFKHQYSSRKYCIGKQNTQGVSILCPYGYFKRVFTFSSDNTITFPHNGFLFG
ncbi:MAG: hypothetical protein ACOCUV_02790, partial [bacterium]